MTLIDELRMVADDMLSNWGPNKTATLLSKAADELEKSKLAFKAIVNLDRIRTYEIDID